MLFGDAFDQVDADAKPFLVNLLAAVVDTDQPMLVVLCDAVP